MFIIPSFCFLGSFDFAWANTIANTATSTMYWSNMCVQKVKFAWCFIPFFMFLIHINHDTMFSFDWWCT